MLNLNLARFRQIAIDLMSKRDLAIKRFIWNHFKIQRPDGAVGVNTDFTVLVIYLNDHLKVSLKGAISNALRSTLKSFDTAIRTGHFCSIKQVEKFIKDF